MYNFRVHLEEKTKISDLINMITCPYVRFELCKELNIHNQHFPLLYNTIKGKPSFNRGDTIKNILLAAKNHGVIKITIPRYVGKHCNMFLKVILICLNI